MDETYLDVSTTLADRNDALVMAAEYNQIAVYDLGGRSEIKTGGTGEATKDSLPVSERLPKLTRGNGKHNNA